MKSELQFFTNEQLDRLVAEKFTVSLMNNSKWERLIEQLTETLKFRIHVSYKLIHSDVVRQTTLTSADFKPFFEEPTLYKEIEWIEFPRSYENFVDANNHRAGKKIYEQDTATIEREIQRIGKFDLEHVPAGVRLYAYK